MITSFKLKNFEDIYARTYNSVLKYIVCKCQNLDDVNELIQDSYVELYRLLEKKRTVKVVNEVAYMIGIANNILKKYYRNQYKEKANILYISKNMEDIELQLPSNLDLETDIINRENIEEIWNYLNNKNVLIAKIFYLYYGLGLKISEISNELEIGESNIKNYIYRTLNELKEHFRKEGDFSEK